MKNCLQACLFLILVGCVNKHTEIIKNSNDGTALGTTYSLVYFANEELDYQNQIDSVFTVINQSMSTYIPTSDISKINKGDSSIVVDKMFQDVFKLSKRINKATDGYFDPTVGVLVNAWGFGPEKQIALDSTKVDSLLNYVGFEKVKLTTDNRIVKTNSSIRFDFNAIAKGYAIDRLAAFFDSKNIQNYLLEVGGELVAKGMNVQKNKNWVVGIDDPQAMEERKLKLLINLKNKALASSGNYRKYRVNAETGEKFVHTVDPKTGFTKNSYTLGVTILAKNCATADAYATAFMAMDLDKTFELLSEQKELDAYIVYLNEEGNVQEFMTDGLRKVIFSPQE